MSSSLPESENAAPNGQVKPSNGTKISRDGDQHKIPRRTPPPRSKSISLLTQGLATTYEVDEHTPTTSTNPASPDSFQLSSGIPRGNTHTPRPHEGGHNNGLTRVLGDGVDETTDNMAVVTSSSSGDLRAGAGFGGATISPSGDYIFPPLVTNHRDILGKNRGRGTSLERTEREKRIHELPKGIYQGNPGDTGMTRAFNSGTPTTSTEISDTQPTEGARAQYRLWRDAHLGSAAEKAWSIGGNGDDDGHGGQVEKSITEALAGVEPNSRSRKSSHSLRFFKEGLPDEPRSRDPKNRGRSKESRHQKALLSGEGSVPRNGALPSPKGTGNVQRWDRSPGGKSPIEPATDRERLRSPNKQTSSNPMEGLSAETGYFDASNGIDTVSEQQLKEMPAQLPADIRTHHNITPGAAKGSSFSRSIPVTESERVRSKTPSGEWEELLFDSPEDGSVGNCELSPIKSADEEEDSGEEQIASALFVPHKTPHESPDRASRSSDEAFQPEFRDPRKQNGSSSPVWLEEHEVPSAQAVETSSEDQVREQPGQSPLGQPRSPEDGSLKRLSQSFDEDEHEELAKVDPFATSDTADADIDNDITPTGSPRETGHIEHFHRQPLPPRTSHDEPKTKQALDAIELIPYRHQVGGHTTMWRFSKRAVCKQLNNGENKFYEKVEHYHPKLLPFLPRYIGVLNVTFEKQARRKPKKENSETSGAPAQESQPDSAEKQPDENGHLNGNAQESPSSRPEANRMISQSLDASAQTIPTVSFADNRHIIPSSFMSSHPHFMESQDRSQSDSAALSYMVHEQNGTHLSESSTQRRASAAENPWGKTHVNKQLRNEVFKDAFLQQPIPIQRHKKPGSQHRLLPTRHGSGLRSSISESSLKTAQQSKPQPTQPDESIRRKAIITAAERRTNPDTLQMTPVKPTREDVSVVGGDESESDNRTGTSAPEYELQHSESQTTGKRQRRYSSGGLRRRPSEVAQGRGNLKYYEEADDAGCKGDVEEVLFSMDSMDPQQQGSSQPTRNSRQDQQDLLSSPKHGDSFSNANLTLQTSHARNNAAVAPENPTKFAETPRPVNPKEARAQPGSRIEYFLLLEDLTAGMKRPCIMDLKMGTRQYGVDANEKKQKSQRSKCGATTSKELGVRVCGLQVWDVKTQQYVFQDKYFGRDLKVGREFQEALTRFLYDGVDYSSVLRHIPTILEKLSKLEVIIRGLIGYRFYAASLLMFYDGGPEEIVESDSTTFGGAEIQSKRKEIDFKIADFANCVTKEDFCSSERACPPRHPDLPDIGFIRGLRSLKHYFLTIQKEIRTEMGIAHREGENGHSVFDDTDDLTDEGNMSY